MKIRFSIQADMELVEAIGYYDYQMSGLGHRFLQEVEQAIGRITAMPEAWTKIGKNTRRCLLKSFPYAIFYFAEGNEIIVTTVAHLHRCPDYYKDRIH